MNAAKRDAVDTVRAGYKQQARLAQLFDEDDALASMATSQQDQNSTSLFKIWSICVDKKSKSLFDILDFSDSFFVNFENTGDT